WGGLFSGVAPALSLLFLALTTVLLVSDLKRPERFAYIVLKPNWRSWLVWGAWILMAFGAAGVAWLAAGATGRSDLLHLVLVPSVLLALATAGYSAFLFGQAEGRDFWQSPLVLPHLIIAAVMAGAADSTALRTVGALLALAGLWLWEDLWVKAGQSVPLS